MYFYWNTHSQVCIDGGESDDLLSTEKVFFSFRIEARRYSSPSRDHSQAKEWTSCVYSEALILWGERTMSNKFILLFLQKTKLFQIKQIMERAKGTYTNECQLACSTSTDFHDYGFNLVIPIKNLNFKFCIYVFKPLNHGQIKSNLG